jgi:hypothetical protein
MVFFLASSVSFAQIDLKHNFAADNQSNSAMVFKNVNASGTAPKAFYGDKGAKGWNLQFAYGIDVGTGVHTDGTYFYVTMWSNDTIFRYDMSGNYVDGFLIAGVTGGKMDLAYDGNHFYGGTIDYASGALGNVIYEMDFTNQTLIGTINTTAEVSEIAYDPTNDAFWIGEWNSDLILVSRTGTTLNTIPYANINLAQMIGAAYDTVTPNGPYLWIHDIGPNSDQARIYQVDVTTTMLTGYYFDVQKDLVTGSTAGGLFVSDQAVPGTLTLGGVVQNFGFFGYELPMCVPDTNDVGVMALLTPQTGANLGANEIVEIEIKNYGFDPQTGFDVTYILNGGAPVTETVNATINGYNTYVFTFSQTCDLSAQATYEFVIYTSLTNDEDTSNDTIYETIAHIAPINAKAYCYPLNSVTVGPSYFEVMFPGTFTNISNQSSMDGVYCGTWGLGNKWYSIVDGTNQFITFDTLTGARTIIGTANPTTGSNELWSGLSYDYSTNQLFAISIDVTSNPYESILYTIDVWTGAATQIGISDGAMINLACNLAGDLYSVDIASDALYEINKFTGMETLIGSIGFDASYAQDMEFDRASNTLYLAAYDGLTSMGSLKIADVNTGMTTTVGAFDGNAEVCGFAIPYYTGVGIDEMEKDFSYNVYPNPAFDHVTVKSTHNIKDYTVINYVGQVVLQGEANSEEFDIDVRSLTTGMYFIQLNTEFGIVTEKISVE